MMIKPITIITAYFLFPPIILAGCRLLYYPFAIFVGFAYYFYLHLCRSLSDNLVRNHGYYFYRSLGWQVQRSPYNRSLFHRRSCTIQIIITAAICKPWFDCKRTIIHIALFFATTTSVGITSLIFILKCILPQPESLPQYGCKN